MNIENIGKIRPKIYKVYLSLQSFLQQTSKIIIKLSYNEKHGLHWSKKHSLDLF